MEVFNHMAAAAKETSRIITVLLYRNMCISVPVWT